MESAKTVYRTVAYWTRKYLEASNTVCGYALSSNLAGTFSVQQATTLANKTIIWSDTITLPTPDALPLYLYIVVYYGKWHSTITCKI